MTPFPPIDRTSASFKSDLDALFLSRLPNFVNEANALQANLNSIAAGGAFSIPLVGWGDNATVKNGLGRFSIPGNQDSIGQIYFNSLDLSGGNLIEIFSELFSTTANNRGYITFIVVGDTSRQVSYRVTGFSIDNVNSRLILYVAFVTQRGAPLAAGEVIQAQLTRNGDKGDSASLQTFVIRDQRNPGVTPQVLSAGTWVTRVINTVVSNGIAGASLSNNAFTLPPGAYLIDGSAGAQTNSTHQIRMFNVTDNALFDVGTSEQVGSINTMSTRSVIRTVIEIAASKTFRIDHWSTSNVQGGSAVNASGSGEIYTELRITKIR